eukprot:TRINITY_DN80206_c0_g1_i1.p1 TRINITY_DN80206_c0_g1~~TRINITY_DN80206_c0_g1_i1.p1  ORF type:complete len:501 (+),score=122.81 TRINITY_DN80206_c0_g1_i1:90-1592(+)
MNVLKALVNVVYGHVPHKEGKGYNPVFFLAAVGNGGIAMAFYVYLFFLMEPKRTLQEGGYFLIGYDDIDNYMDHDQAWLVVLCLIAFLFFSLRHYILLLSNIKEYFAWRKTPEYQHFQNSNHYIMNAAFPSAVAMSVIVGFVIVVIFGKGLTDDRNDDGIEAVLIVTTSLFSLIGLWGLYILIDFFTSRLVKGNFDCGKNNSLGSMISVFCLALVATGLGGPASISKRDETAIFALTMSLLFVVMAMTMFNVQLVLGFRSMLENGLEPKAAASLLIVVPIMTVTGIAIIRALWAVQNWFMVPFNFGFGFIILTVFLGVSILFLLIGMTAMGRCCYVKLFVGGPICAPGSYAMVCPGVGITVLYTFWLNFGLVYPGIVTKFGTFHWLMMTPAFVVHLITIVVILRLDYNFMWTVFPRSAKGTEEVCAKKEQEHNRDIEEGEAEHVDPDTQKNEKGEIDGEMGENSEKQDDAHEVPEVDVKVVVEDEVEKKEQSEVGDKKEN